MIGQMDSWQLPYYQDIINRNCPLGWATNTRWLQNLYNTYPNTRTFATRPILWEFMTSEFCST